MHSLPTPEGGFVELSWVGLIVLGIKALLVGGLLVWFVVSVANRKTRAWTLRIGGVVAVVVLLVGGSLVGWWVSQAGEAAAARRHAEAMRQIQTTEAARARSEVLDSLDIEPPDVVPLPALPSDFAQARVIEERAPRMSAGFIGLMIPLVALLGLGLIAVFVYLLSVLSPKTRSVALLVGAGFATFVVLAFVSLFFVRYSESERAHQRAATLVPAPEPILPDRPVEIPLDGPHAVETFPTQVQTATITTSADEPEAKSLLRTIGVAVGRAISAAQDEIAREAAKELARTPEAASAASDAAPARPGWVDREPDRNAKGNYEMPISVGPFATRSECQDALTAALQDAVARYAATSLGTRGMAKVQLPLAYIREHIVQDEWEEWKQYSSPLGEMVKLHVLLEFDRQTNARLQEAWKHVVVGRRLRGLAAVGGVLLALLATAWGYLKIDLATEGRNRNRLRLGAAGVALAVLATGAVFLA